MDFYTVTKIGRGFYVMDAFGNEVIGYRDRATSEKVATSLTSALFSGAEDYDSRRSAALEYLARRATRASVPVDQMELF